MKGIFLSVAILAIFVFAVGPKNLASIATRAFSPSAGVYLGEIPLDKIPSNNDGIEPSGVFKDTTRGKTTSTPVGVKVYTANLVSKIDNGDVKMLNDKLKLLEGRISDLVSILDSGASSQSQTSQISPETVPNQGGIIDYTTQPSVQQNPASAIFKTGRILVSEIMTGADSSTNYEFVELYNAGANSVDLTGWSLKKKISTGSEGSLVSAKLFSGKIIPPNRYLLLGNASGYAGSAALDIAWSSSNTLAYKKNAVALYDSDGNKMEEIYWENIPKGQSLARTGWTSGEFVLTTSPTPQNSQSQ